MSTGKEIFKGHGLFKSLDPQFTEKFISKAAQKTFSKGDVVYVESSEGDEIYLILEGSVRVSAELAGSKAVNLGKGEFFGLEMAIQKGPRSVTATADSNLEVWVWKTGDWQGLCESDSKQGYQLLLAIAKELHKRMHVWTQTVLDNASWGIE